MDMEGVEAGVDLESKVKEFKKTYKSHRRVSMDV